MKKILTIFLLFSFTICFLFGCSNKVINIQKPTTSGLMEESTASFFADNGEDNKPQSTIMETPSSSTSLQVAVTNNVSNVSDYGQIGAKLVDDTLTYMFGGNSIENVNESLGEPDRKIEYDDFVRYYYEQGLEIDVLYQNDQPVLFNYIYFHPACALETEKSVGVGSSKEDVLKEYCNGINAEKSNDNVIVVGDNNIGIIFIIFNDTISSMYIALGRYTYTSGPPREIPYISGDS